MERACEVAHGAHGVQERPVDERLARASAPRADVIRLYQDERIASDPRA